MAGCLYRAIACTALVLSWLLVLTPARADSADTPQTLSVPGQCAGGCWTPRVVELDERQIVALWRDDLGTYRVQSIDLRTHTLVGSPGEVGKLLTKDPSEGRAIVPVATVAGDLALFGALRDGRITFARGSMTPAQRVPAMSLLPASDAAVSSLAATRTPAGFALLILRRSRAAASEADSMHVELHQLDALGSAVSAAQRWTAPPGTAARIAQCGDTLHVAWQTTRGLISQTIAGDGRRSSPVVHAQKARTVYAASQPLCIGSDARLLVAWPGRGSAADERLSIAYLGSRSARPGWREIKLPGSPTRLPESDNELSVIQRQPQRAAVLVETKRGAAVVEVNLTTGTRSNSLQTLASSRSCTPLAQAGQAACMHENNDRDAHGCRIAGLLTFSRFGEATRENLASPPAPLLWAKSQLKESDAPSEHETRLRCGEPGWEPLRRALSEYCAAQAKLAKELQEQYLSAYCGAEPDALEHQARTCTLPGHRCPGARDTTPTVDRTEYDEARWVEFRHRNCAVWFTRESGTWRVVDGECDGD